ncbi:EamA family transporter [Thermoanaerobacterium thermosaccharolyticum]|uniref:EamA family transporter n=1 Tax=Thermoanaerobacterium thermosaccharolyticum TaxID=1517 RepID=UPI001E3C8EF5|nr:EamA family transporter [Thermoanaerobacterium thermosaccharolyticum]
MVLLYYLPIILTVIANVFYHIFQKMIPEKVDPIASLILTYCTALIGSLMVFVWYHKNINVIESFKGLNWTSCALGLSIILLEFGFLLAYRVGWDISLGAIVSNVSVTLLLIPIGIIFFKENISMANLIGILLCIIGLVLINSK